MREVHEDLTCTCPWCDAPMVLQEDGERYTWRCTGCVGCVGANVADIEAAVYRRDHGIGLDSAL